MSLSGCFSEVHPIPCGNRFSKRNAYLGFASGDYVRPGTLERGGVAKVCTTHENAQVGVKKARLPNDFSGILDIGAEYEAARARYARFVKSSGPQNIAVDGRKAVCS
jgi:hypothetical protein